MYLRITASLALASSITLALLANVAGAAAPAVRLAEVRAAPTIKDSKISSALRQALLSGINRLRANATRRSSSSRYLLSATLTRLDVSKSEDTVSTRCVVSMTLRNEKSGALIAFVDGTSRVTQAADAAIDARIDAVEAAVRGALERMDASLE